MIRQLESVVRDLEAHVKEAVVESSRSLISFQHEKYDWSKLDQIKHEVGVEVDEVGLERANLVRVATSCALQFRNECVDAVVRKWLPVEWHGSHYCN